MSKGLRLGVREWCCCCGAEERVEYAVLCDALFEKDSLWIIWCFVVCIYIYISSLLYLRSRLLGVC